VVPPGFPAQLPLPFPRRPNYGRDTYFVTQANRSALELIDRWPDWPSNAAAITAPKGGGKTHLLNVWIHRARAVLIDGREMAISHAAHLPERFCAAIDDAQFCAATKSGSEALFHILNRAHQEGGYVLLTGEVHPSQWPTGLADLRSRLGAVMTAEIDQPDDTLMAAVLTKLFSDFQLSAPPGLVSFIIARIERSYAAAGRLAHAMDNATIGTGRTLSYELADRLIKEDGRD
jgi:chromosomal replication initiation ATPase DnaA